MPFLLAALCYPLWALALPFLWLHPKMRGSLGQRLGRYPQLPLHKAHRWRILLHGASAGDVLALVPTARALKKVVPDCWVALTTLTGSGVTVGQQQGGLFDAVLLSPLDTPWTVKRCMQQLKPHVVVLEYTELWPAYIAGAKRAGAYVVLHNGRFGLNRLWRYRLLFALTGNLVRKLDLLLMRDAQQVEAAIQLGAEPQRVCLTGNTKFDSLYGPVPEGAIEQLRRATGLTGAGPVLVCGSTHEGEEELLLTVYQALCATVPKLRLILAPRYTERGDAIAQACSKHKLTWRRRTMAPQKPLGEASAQVFILDTIGELRACYGLADVVFVGGSFTTRGGQNILEPAQAGKPVVFGPNMGNFTDAVAVLAGRGGIQVHDAAQLQRVLSDLLHDGPMRLRLGRIAQTQVQAVGGASLRNAQHLHRLLTAP